MWPMCEFDHEGEQFTPAVHVPADHRMVALRPDLFTHIPPKTPRKPKE